MTSLKSNITLENEELEILNYIEEKNPKSISNLENKISKIKNIVSDNVNKKKQINFRILESDLEKLKSKAIENWMPYQTFLNSIIHRYLKV